VLHGDNELVRRLGLKHPDLARPLFHVWNLLLREFELESWAVQDDVGSFWYHRRRFTFGHSGPKVSRKPSSTTRSRARFDIELWRSWMRTNGSSWRRPTRI